MGGIVRSVETRAFYEGLQDPAVIGEVLKVPGNAAVKYRVELDIPELGFDDQPNRIDRLEIISNCLGPPAVVWTFEPVGTGRTGFEYTLPAGAGPRPGACFLRARGRRIVDGPGNGLLEADLMFYTGGTRLRFGP
jgi:hypothetical protein